jgi:hypothetical protein
VLISRIIPHILTLSDTGAGRSFLYIVLTQSVSLVAMFTPSRRAPLPPSTPITTTSSYPYASYSQIPTYEYIPLPSESPNSPSPSYTSIQSNYTIYAPKSIYPTHSHSRSLSNSTTSPTSPRFTASPPLSHSSTYSPPNHPIPSPKNIQTPISTSYIPKDLQLFNHSSRQTLLSDLEYISGKRFRFPILKRFSLGSEDDDKAKKELKRGGSLGAGRVKEKEVGKLRKTKWEEEIPGVVIIEKRGRGVREGNWI